MNLALCVVPEQPVPPPLYGGVERVAAISVKKLLERGHAVDLYAGPGTTAEATRRLLAPKASMSAEPFYLHEIERLRKAKYTYDCVIDMTAFHLLGERYKGPVVSIMSGDAHKKYPHDKVRNRIYVSKEFAAFNGCLDHPVLHNLIHENPESIPLGPGGGGYTCYIGVIRPEKGLHLAAEACEKAGVPFRVAGPVLDQKYWKTIKDKIEYHGIISDKGKWELLSNADAYLYPCQWCDAGPLGPMEAMLVGTPVIALQGDWPVGGLGEDLIEGVTGCFVPDDDMGVFTDELKDAMEGEGMWGRSKVRESILPKIDPNVYADKLIGLCEKANEGEEW